MKPIIIICGCPARGGMMLEITKLHALPDLSSLFFPIGCCEALDAPKRRAVIRTDAVLGHAPGLGAQRSAVGSSGNME